MTISKRDAESSALKNPQFAELESIDAHPLTPRSFLSKQIYDSGLILLKCFYTFQVFLFSHKALKRKKLVPDKEEKIKIQNKKSILLAHFLF